MRPGSSARSGEIPWHSRTPTGSGPPPSPPALPSVGRAMLDAHLRRHPGPQHPSAANRAVQPGEVRS
eukprot:3178328-Alexandrium_andersonii.AAC.1